MSNKCALLLAAAGISTLSGCAHTQVARNAAPAQLFHEACAPGNKIREVRGSIWMKATSKEASGQFPAAVEAVSPDRLRLEVTNLLGGTEAVITLQGHEYRIEVPGKKERTEKGSHSWGGIPLEWAEDLFLGRVPCPAHAFKNGDAKIQAGEAPGELLVEIPASLQGGVETYRYRFRQWAGRPWPESLRWERQGTPPITVDFKFDDPENDTRSPQKWEAKSAQGEVKVRWKDRQLR